MPNEHDTLLLIILSQTFFLTLREKLILLKNLDTGYNITLLSIKDIAELIGRMPKRAVWDGKKMLHDAQATATILKARNISFVAYDDENYPALLKEIPDAPLVLFYRGELSALKRSCISVVGSRHLSFEGATAAHDFAYNAALDGFNVVSGLAYGADGKVHSGAIDAFYDCCQKDLLPTDKCGRTIAVLPCGIDLIVPAAHKRLAQQILETGGVLISEYAPQVLAQSWRFVQRNRIIAGLSSASVVIQAPPGSGALLTADFALDYNRELLFHEAAFCSSAKEIAQRIKKDLEVKILRGEKNKGKIEKTVERYIDEGASVVKNYDDYKKFLSEIPGTRVFKTHKDMQQNKDCQPFLFTE